MADNNDDILNLGPEDPNSSPTNGSGIGQTPPKPANRKIAGASSNTNTGESIQRRLYKRLPFLLGFVIIGIVAILFMVKGLVSSGIHHAMQGQTQKQKAKPLGYNAQQQQSEISSIQRMLQEEQQAKKSAPVSSNNTTKPTHHHAALSSGFGPGIPGQNNADMASAEAKAAQIAASPLVALHGVVPHSTQASAQQTYAPNSPQAIQAKIAQLKEEQRKAYQSASDSDLGIGQMEKLAMEASGASGNGKALANQESEDEQWEKGHAGSAGYGGLIPTLPKLQGVALYPGAIIPAETISRLDTQTPGQIVAQVTRTVYSASGVIAIPAGSRLIGRYDGQMFNGQNRVMMAFSRVIFPGGKEIALQGMNATGPRGANGVNGNLHTHFWTALGSSLLVALITDGVDSIPNPNNSTTGNTYVGGGNSPTQAGAQVLQQQANNLLQPYTNIQPTVTIPPGTTFRIMVNKTILLPSQ